MSAVSEMIVREYFEAHGFFVRQQRKHIAPSRVEDEEIDFLVINPAAETVASLPFELASADLRGIRRAVVVVKGWHTETFSPGILANSPAIFRFLEEAVFKQATRAFGSREPITKLMVVPALPGTEELKRQSIEMLQAKGIDAVLVFRTLLADLVDLTEVNRNYVKSDLLQVIRILKNYDFFRDPQLELFKARRKKMS